MSRPPDLGNELYADDTCGYAFCPDGPRCGLPGLYRWEWDSGDMAVACAAHTARARLTSGPYIAWMRSIRPVSP